MQVDRKAQKISNVMFATKCTWLQAYAELVAEEWDEADAILNLRAHLAGI